ncbi:hypothetical protein [Shinella oryzae]|uniref:hypothetical protein n=1 Tax=Shinella oryzae TaxID=2871820 RepID=UPI001FF6545A|nr:hypothetical protein [Shinella oryzae]
MDKPSVSNSTSYCSPADVRRSLSYLMPQLAPYWERPLTAYASKLYRVEHVSAESAARNHAKDLFRTCIERAARRSSYTEEEARSAGRELVASPVLQTGPHCLLLFEPDAFYTHLFSMMGLMAHNRNWYISYFASTSGFSERAKKGPGWLRVGGEPLNLFGVPRNRMDSSSIGCLNGPYRYALTNAKGESAPNADAACLLANLPSAEFASAAEAIKAGNRDLWRRTFSQSIRLLQLDDFDVADLIADHLEDPTSWISSQFIGNRTIANSILTALDDLQAGPWAGWIRRTTDFFWRISENRVTPLHLKGDALISDNAPTFSVRFRPDAIAAALRNRLILPNLLLAFLAISILPGVRVLGGFRQVVYYPLMRYLTSAGIQQAGNADLLADMVNDNQPGVWGHRVLRRAESDPFHEVNIAGGIAPLLQAYGKLSLSDASGDLTCFTEDCLWSRLAANIANGTIASASDEWRWSDKGSRGALSRRRCI